MSSVWNGMSLRRRNKIAKLFPNQVIYTSCIDEEDEKTQLLVPGIGNPLSRLSTIFQDKN